jgi:hypothetical protein
VKRKKMHEKEVLVLCEEEEEEEKEERTKPVPALKYEGIREKENGGKSIVIDNKYERAHPICHGCFSQNGQTYGATFHSKHHCERHYFPKYIPHTHLGIRCFYMKKKYTTISLSFIFMVASIMW